MSVYEDSIGLQEEKAPESVYEESLISRTVGAVSDFFTGDDRKTRATEEIPEALSEIGVSEMLGPDVPASQKAAATAALTTAFDPEEFVNILKANTPENITTAYDEKGNMIIQIGETGKGERLVMINKPGLSKADILQAGAVGSLFTPAGLTRQAGVRGALQVGGKSAATQAVVEGGQAATGGEFNEGDVAIAGVAGTAFQGLANQLAKKFPSLAQADDVQMTDDVRAVVREEAIKLGFEPDSLTDDVVDQLVSEIRLSAKPSEAMAVTGEREFGIPLTAGQRSMDDAALSFEDRARSGAMGSRAQRPIREFETQEQNPAINRAVDDVQSRIGERITTQQEAGGLVAEGVRSAEAAADDLVRAAYDEVGEASLGKEGMNGLLNATRKAVIGIDKDRGLAGTKGLLEQLKRTQRVINSAGEQKPVALTQIEQLRRRINTAIDSSENAADKRQLVQMKRAFDDFMDEAVVKALFDGDEQALSQLKNARGLFAEYAAKFRANPTTTRSGRNIPDQQGAFIEKIIESNPTDEQVINAVFGASNFSNTSGARMAARFRDVLGADSQGWDAIRQAGFMRLVKTNSVNGEKIVSGQQSLNALNTALEKNGSLMRELYSQEEINLFRRLFAQIQRAQPQLVRSRENPSGTAQAMLKSVTDLATRMAGLFSGDLTMVLTSNGVQAARGVRSATRAANAVRPFQDVVLPKPALNAAGQVAIQDL